MCSYGSRSHADINRIVPLLKCLYYMQSFLLLIVDGPSSQEGDATSPAPTSCVPTASDVGHSPHQEETLSQ